MELMNERQQIKAVARKWKRQYPTGVNGGVDIGAKLAALDVEAATADDVAQIIGNRSWVAKETCDECGAETWDAVQLGEEPDYESSTATICGDCLRAALRLLGDA
jgi:hypothetical protein